MQTAFFRIFAVILLACAMLSNRSEGATPITIPTEFEKVNVTQWTDILFDPLKEMTVSDAKKSLNWKRENSSAAIIGYTNAAVWQRFSFNPHTQDVYLRLTSSSLDNAIFWCFTEKREIKQIAGDTYRKADRAIPDMVPSFKVPNEASECYLRVESTSTITLSPSILSQKTFSIESTSGFVIFGLLQGAFAIIVMTSIAASIMSRSIRIWLYSGTALFYMLWSSANSGGMSDIMQFLPSYYRDLLPMIYGSFGLMCMALFLWSSIECSWRWLPFTSAIIMAIYALSLIALPQYWLVGAKLNGLLGAIVISINLSATFIGWRKYKEKIAVMFFGQLIFFIPSAAFLLLISGKLPGNIYTINSLSIGSMAELVVFAARVGQTYRALVRKNEMLLADRVKVLSDEAIELMHILKHDVQHPISIVANGISTMIKRDGLNSEKGMLLGRIKQAQRIITSILAYDRDETLEVSIEKVDLTSVLSNVITENDVVLSRMDQRIDMHLPSNSIFVNGNKEFIEHIVDNVISNFNKHTPNGSLLYVDSGAEHDTAWITFDDNGAGEPVFRDDRKSSGLNSIRRRMKMMGGSAEFGLSPTGAFALN